LSKTEVDAVAAELLESLGRIRRQARRRLGRPGPLASLSTAQLELVRVVRRAPGISVGLAAAELGVAANTVSTLVGALQQADIVRRGADPEDRRTARLYLTPAAKRRVERWRDERAAVVADAIGTLSERDRRAIVAALPALAAVAAAMGEAT
jgi:DNA-binding MarR family transcriptional regulator